MDIIIWHLASLGRIIVCIIKNAISNCYRIKKEKKRERNSEIKGNNQWNCSELNAQAQGLGKIFQFRPWNVRVWFFPENCCNHRWKRIEAVRSHRYSCRSSNERVCNHSVHTTLTTEPSCVCLIELKTEYILNDNFYPTHWNKTTEVRNIRIHHLTQFFNGKPQDAVVLSLEPADGMVKATLKKLWKPDSTYFIWHPICTWTFRAAGTQIELQRVQVNQCQFCVV